MLRTIAARPGSVKLLQLQHAHRHFSTYNSIHVYGSKAEKLSAAVPGTVKDYEHHILIQTSPPKSDATAKELHSLHGCWWPSVVEKHPAVMQAVAAAAKAQIAGAGTVKVTTYEEASRDTFAEAGRRVCDVRVYPAGVQYHNIPIDKVSQVTAAHIAQQSSHLEDDSAPQPEPKLELSEELAQLQQPITGVQLLVCCHGSRDVRCGNIGNSLVKSLHRLIHEQQLEDKIEVLKCSHVGGHKYAGNVLVYGPMSPCDGDWFGGVNPRNAAEFLDAVINVEVGSEGGAEEPTLRHLWRGRMGMSKQEQLDLFEGRAEDSEPESSDTDEIRIDPKRRVYAAGYQQDSAASLRQYSTSSSISDGEFVQPGSSHICSCGNEFAAPGSDVEEGTDVDSTSSEELTSSSSSSDGESSDSGGDPDMLPPVEVHEVQTR